MERYKPVIKRSKHTRVVEHVAGLHNNGQWSVEYLSFGVCFNAPKMLNPSQHARCNVTDNLGEGNTFHIPYEEGFMWSNKVGYMFETKRTNRNANKHLSTPDRVQFSFRARSWFFISTLN